jgi:hypothetical protein
MLLRGFSMPWCRSAFALVLFLAATTSHLAGQIVELREYRGKTITCAVSGLVPWGSPCGTDGDYAYVFVGSVLSTIEISEMEKRVEITPHEIFLGDPPNQLVATTSQGACLPEIVPGDQWLFYLRRDEKTNELTLGYGDPIGPIADAQANINRLRRLAAMSGKGLITGFIQEAVHGDGETEYIPVSNHKVTAKREPDGTEYSTLTDDDGMFEFEPLPAGTYDLTANTEPGLWSAGGPITVTSHGCTLNEFQLRVDGTISGHVRSSDGKPLKWHPWIQVVSEDGSHSESAHVEEDGHYEVRGLEPDVYLVGIGIQAAPGTAEWGSRIYYPGVHTKENATPIKIGRAEKRTDIDLLLPNSKAR